ncbi:MAG: hypothetical protein QW228_07685 [Candidatus Aenigmatarchaeota archaeon]
MRDYYSIFRYMLEGPEIKLEITKHSVDVLAYPDKLIKVDYGSNKTKDYIYNLLRRAKLPFISFAQDDKLWFVNLSRGYIQLTRKPDLMYELGFAEIQYKDVIITSNYRAFGFESIFTGCSHLASEKEISYVHNELGLDFVLKVCEILYLNPAQGVKYRIGLQPLKITLKGAFLTHQLYDAPSDIITTGFLLAFSEIVNKTYEIIDYDIRQVFTEPLTSKKDLLKAYTNKFLLPIFSQKLNITELDLNKIEDAEKGLKYIKKLLTML